ncbi:thioredoxin family protein [Rhodoflexus sp.]
MKNKAIFFASFLWLMLIAAHVQSQGIDFEAGDWMTVLAKAKATNRLIFVDVYTDWCAPCKKLEKEVFTHPEVASFFNQNFVNFKINAEEGEGVEFSSIFEVDAYPCALFINAEGRLVHRTVGYFKPKAFIENGRQALDPERQLITLAQRYESGDRSKQLLRNYAYSLFTAGDAKATLIARELLTSQSPESWYQPENWELIRTMELDMEGPVFNYIAKNPKIFAPYEPEYSQYIHLVTGRAMFKVGRSQQVKRLQTLKQTLKYYFPQDSAKHIARADFYFYTIGNHNETKYAAAAHYLDHYCTDWQELNEMAWNYYEQEETQPQLQKALEWAEKSVRLNKTYQNMDTKAHLLYKLGQNSAAATAAREAIALGEATGMEISMTKELLLKITQPKR